ncbi:MAG: undecaprenyldiphospho-muramoylpentapeptide beta-N-acetylglucosaminyltransferase [Mariprofundaceae bacterium]
MKAAPLLCIAGGGTGGHVMPALALADAAREKWNSLDVVFIGVERGLEARLLPERGETVLLLRMHSIQGAALMQKLRVLLWELPKSVLQIHRYWKTRRPNLVVGVGGYASTTGVIAAVLSRIPVILYEQNAVPGLVNRKLAPFCQRIMLGFAAAAGRLPLAKCSITGNIVNDSLSRVNRQFHQPPRLLVLGGSQGARFLNETVPKACALLVSHGLLFTVSHIAGPKPDNIHAVKQAYAEAGIDVHVLGFCNDMPAFYTNGDLLIARAGAMTVSEAAMCGMPSVFIPLPHAADQHQLYNARSMAEHGGARIVEQHEASVEQLAASIKALLFDRNVLDAMSRSARDFAPLDAKKKQLAVLGEVLGSQESDT